MTFSDLILRLPLLAFILALMYGVDSETSYSWRLDIEMGKVMPSAPLPSTPEGSNKNNNNGESQEAVLDILMSTVTDRDGMWKKTSKERFCSHCNHPGGSGIVRNNRGLPLNDWNDPGDRDDEDDEEWRSESLECGRSANFTYYDHLVGIQNRQTHPHWPEPEVASTFRQYFKKSSSGKQPRGDLAIEDIERKLKKSKREKPKSIELYNQMGNFWRVKGDTQKSIECFRRALAVAPNNAEILLNLARVLFKLQYLDDAIFLTRRSLEVQPPDQNAWLQHFQLGEILKAYCHYQEAALHLRHVLELKPNYAPAIAALQDMESLPDSTVHVYTVIIIVLLVLGVLFWIATTLDVGGGTTDDSGDVKGKFHSLQSRVKNKKLL